MSKLSKLETVVDAQDKVTLISNRVVFESCAFIIITGKALACIHAIKHNCGKCILDSPTSFKDTIDVLELV